ncbi:MAG TPA: hypothetical protein VME86_14540 [Acidobacteriaceae bacterium]|nr:hypothetical protein [Acidobacteriaceae bacterium]
MHHHAPVVRSTSLTITYKDKSLTFSPAQLSALPQTTVTVYNAHTKVRETYSGVPLTALLAKLGVPQGEKVRGRLLMTGVIAEGTDGYQVLYALAEVDPTIHTGHVLVADSEDGKPIATDGAFKMIATEEKRPARWVRNLDRICVMTAKP